MGLGLITLSKYCMEKFQSTWTVISEDNEKKTEEIIKEIMKTEETRVRKRSRVDLRIDISVSVVT